eukprot:1302047-Amphidinium_carterae.1
MADQSLTYFNGTLDEFEEAAAEKERHMEREAAAIERKRDMINQSIHQKEQQLAKSDKNRSKNKDSNKKAVLHDVDGKGRAGLISAQQHKLERLGMERTEDGK